MRASYGYIMNVWLRQVDLMSYGRRTIARKVPKVDSESADDHESEFDGGVSSSSASDAKR